MGHEVLFSSIYLFGGLGLLGGNGDSDGHWGHDVGMHFSSACQPAIQLLFYLQL